MNKEIEETRKNQAEQKLLVAYMETIQQQLRDRGLFFVFAVCDKANGNMVSGIECKSTHLAPMISDLVSRTMTTLAQDGVRLRRQLHTEDETWNDDV